MAGKAQGTRQARGRGLSEKAKRRPSGHNLTGEDDARTAESEKTKGRTRARS